LPMHFQFIKGYLNFFKSKLKYYSFFKGGK